MRNCRLMKASGLKQSLLRRERGVCTEPLANRPAHSVTQLSVYGLYSFHSGLLLISSSHCLCVGGAFIFIALPSQITLSLIYD